MKKNITIIILLFGLIAFSLYSFRNKVKTWFESENKKTEQPPKIVQDGKQVVQLPKKQKAKPNIEPGVLIKTKEDCDCDRRFDRDCDCDNKQIKNRKLTSLVKEPSPELDRAKKVYLSSPDSKRMSFEEFIKTRSINDRLL